MFPCTTVGSVAGLDGHGRGCQLNIPSEQYITTSDQFLDASSLPKRILFIGGGYISMVFAHVSLRAGCEVTILHRGERLLESFDPDLVQQLSFWKRLGDWRQLFTLRRKSRRLREAMTG